MLKNLFFTSAISTLLTTQTYANFNYDETISTNPEKVQNELPILPTLCVSKEKGLWDLCFSVIKDADEIEERELRAKSIKLRNQGGNPTFPQTGWMVGRDFEFNFEDIAQSDLNMIVWDMPDDYDSNGHMMMMTFIPRQVIPSVRYESLNKIKVTLPTSEEITFDARTKEIIGGVITEGKVATDSGGRALRPSMKYTGKGLAIVASRVGNFPVGDELVGTQRTARNKADIIYNQKTICQLPVKDLWFTDYSKKGQVLLRPEFATDKALIEYIEKKCKTKISL